MKRYLSYVGVLIFSVFILCSPPISLEAANLNKDIINKWFFNVNGKDRISFFEDGRFIVSYIASDNTVGGYYKFSDNRLSVDIHGGTFVFKISIDKEGGLNLTQIMRERLKI